MYFVPVILGEGQSYDRSGDGRTVLRFRGVSDADKLWENFTDEGGDLESIEAVSGHKGTESVHLMTLNNTYCGNDYQGTESRYYAAAILARVTVENDTRLQCFESSDDDDDNDDDDED